MKKVMLAAGGLLILALLAGCQEEKNVVGSYIPREIMIGVVVPESGPFAQVGQSARQGIDYAVTEINRIGGIRGATIRTTVIDDHGEPPLSAQRVGELSGQEQIVAIIGGLLDSTAFAGAIQANRKRIVFLSPNSGATGIPEIGQYIFRNRISYARNTNLLAEYLFQVEGKRSFGIIFPYDDFGANMAEVFQRRVKELGGIISAKESYPPDSFDFAGAVKQVGDAKPQAVFIPCYSPELLGIAQLMYQQGFGTMAAGIESWTDDGKIGRGLDYLDGAVYTTSFYVDSYDKNTSTFVAGYKARYGVPPDRIAAHCADAVRILAQCMYAGGFSREGIKEEMSRIKNFPGLTGRTSFNNGRDAEKQIIFLTINSGKIEKLK